MELNEIVRKLNKVNIGIDLLNKHKDNLKILTKSDRGIYCAISVDYPVDSKVLYELQMELFVKQKEELEKLLKEKLK